MSNSLCNISDSFETLFLRVYLRMVAKYTQCALLHDDCSIRVYWLFVTLLYKGKCKFGTNVFYIFPFALALCLMFSVTNYIHNCAGMMGGSLMATAACFLGMGHFLHSNSCMFKLCGTECMATATCLINSHGWQVW